MRKVCRAERFPDKDWTENAEDMGKGRSPVWGTDGVLKEPGIGGMDMG